MQHYLECSLSSCSQTPRVTSETPALLWKDKCHGAYGSCTRLGPSGSPKDGWPCWGLLTLFQSDLCWSLALGSPGNSQRFFNIEIRSYNPLLRTAVPSCHSGMRPWFISPTSLKPWAFTCCLTHQNLLIHHRGPQGPLAVLWTPAVLPATRSRHLLWHAPHLLNVKCHARPSSTTLCQSSHWAYFPRTYDLQRTSFCLCSVHCPFL